MLDDILGSFDIASPIEPTLLAKKVEVIIGGDVANPVMFHADSGVIIFNQGKVSIEAVKDSIMVDHSFI